MSQKGVFKNINNKIFAIGDIHGDLSVLKHILIDLTKVCYLEEDEDKKKIFRWKEGNNSILVFCGDLIDRYRNKHENDKMVDPEDSDFMILNILMNLHDQAKKYNGKVIIIIGNHELLNFKGYFNYTSPYVNLEHRKKCFKPGSEFMTKLSEYSYLSVQINNYIFVHGGFCPEAFENNHYLQSGCVLDKLNNILFKYMRNNDFFVNSNINKFEKNQMRIIIQALYDKKVENRSPLNCRSFSIYPEVYNCKEELENKVLKYFDKDYKKLKMIIAHTPQFIYGKNINIGCDNKVWRLDVGMSKAFDEHKEYILQLFIDYGIKAFDLINRYIKNDKNRYISILELNNNDEKVITENKYSRSIIKSEAAFLEKNLEELIVNLREIKVSDSEKIIKKIQKELIDKI